MLKVSGYCSFALRAVLLSLVSILGQAEDSKKHENEKVHAYTKAFAKRFVLPAPNIELEPNGGLQAIELSIEKTQGSEGSYWCVLKTYLDSSLPIAYPLNGSGGSRNLVELPEHFIFDNNASNQRWLSLSVEDRLHFSSQNTFGRRAALASPDLDWPKKGYWGGLVYDGFYRELFSGVSYIKFGGSCGAFVAGEAAGSVQLWIERVGGADYARIVKPDPQDFLKLNLPSRFYKRRSIWQNLQMTTTEL
jgi:hypothetical protein